MVDTSIKKPFNASLAAHSNEHANNFQQQASKGMPCHVTKVTKDMVTVAFEPNNGVWTMPTMEMPQAFSPYSRDPTQVGDKGYASPADYYMGGVSGLGGGKTSFAPKGNLTPLVFHPVSRKDNEKRDYDQLTMAGGKNGVKIVSGLRKKTGAGPTPTPQGMRGLGGYTSIRRVRGLSTAARRAWQDCRKDLLRDERAARAGEETSDAKEDRASMQIDKDGVIIHQGKDPDKLHQVIVDSDKAKIALNVPAKDHIVYLGGPGKQIEFYAPVLCGGLMPSVNVWAKVIQQDEDA